MTTAIADTPLDQIVRVRLDRLDRLRTEDLIDQYRLAISSNRGRYSNVGPRQRRINTIVNKLLVRAECGDDMAERWLAA